MKAIKEGINAFYKAQKGGKYFFLSANPYRPDTQKNREWEHGYNKAYHRNLEKVKAREARKGS